MNIFKDCTFISSDGDKIVASFDGNILKISNPGIEMEVELKGVLIDNWFEKENIRIKLNDDSIEISKETKDFPINTVRYFRFDC